MKRIIALSLIALLILCSCRDSKQTVDRTTTAATTAAPITSEPITTVETREESLIGEYVIFPPVEEFGDDTDIYEKWFYGSFEVTDTYSGTKNRITEDKYTVVNDYIIHDVINWSDMRYKLYHFVGKFYEDTKKAMIFYINGGVGECWLIFKDNPDKLYFCYCGIIGETNGIYSYDCVIVNEYTLIKSESDDIGSLCGNLINRLACVKIKNTLGDDFSAVFDENIKDFTDENGVEWRLGDDFSPPVFTDIILNEYDTKNGIAEFYVQYLNYTELKNNNYPADYYSYLQRFKFRFIKSDTGWELLPIEPISEESVDYLYEKKTDKTAVCVQSNESDKIPESGLSALTDYFSGRIIPFINVDDAPSEELTEKLKNNEPLSETEKKRLLLQCVNCRMGIKILDADISFVIERAEETDTGYSLTVKEITRIYYSAIPGFERMTDMMENGTVHEITLEKTDDAYSVIDRYDEGYFTGMKSGLSGEELTELYNGSVSESMRIKNGAGN